MNSVKTYLSIPANCQDFEDLCYVLWKVIWSDPHAQKNGRQGDAQNGVDVYGRPIGKLNFEGVQCKGKNSYLEKQVTLSEVKSE